MKADGHKSKANEIKNSIEKKRGQSVMMPRHHPETHENHALNFSIYCRGLIYQARPRRFTLLGLMNQTPTIDSMYEGRLFS